MPYFTPQSSFITVDDPEPMELIVTEQDAAHVQCHDQEDSITGNNKVDIEDVACGCLLKLRCKPGVTESLLNEITESVMNGVLLNLKADIAEHFERSKSDYNTTDTTAVISPVDNASDPLASLSTTYRLKSITPVKYPTVVISLDIELMCNISILRLYFHTSPL